MIEYCTYDCDENERHERKHTPALSFLTTKTWPMRCAVIRRAGALSHITQSTPLFNIFSIPFILLPKQQPRKHYSHDAQTDKAGGVLFFLKKKPIIITNSLWIRTSLFCVQARKRRYRISLDPRLKPKKRIRSSGVAMRTPYRSGGLQKGKR